MSLIGLLRLFIIKIIKFNVDDCLHCGGLNDGKKNWFGNSTCTTWSFLDCCKYYETVRYENTAKRRNRVWGKREAKLKAELCLDRWFEGEHYSSWCNKRQRRYRRARRLPGCTMAHRRLKGLKYSWERGLDKQRRVINQILKSIMTDRQPMLGCRGKSNAEPFLWAD